MQEIIGLIAAVFLLYNCSGGGYGTDRIFGPPETLPQSRYEDVNVNVLFYFPNGDEYPIGETKGASSCKAMAWDYARAKNVENAMWSYVCCTKENGSSCYRKIR